MANAVAEWSETAANNMSLGAIGLDGATMPPSQIDNAFRELMAQVAVAGLGKFFIKGADIASATTTDLSTTTGQFVNITGTTTIEGFGTVAEGRWTIAKFTGALTLTYNASSFILPGLANITTAANDVAFLMSLGSGNWQCIAYTRAAGLPTIGPTSSTDNAIARFDGATGRIQNSGVTISDGNAISAASVSTSGGLTVGSSATVGTFLRVGDGSSGAPTLSFTNDTDTGLFSTVANQINFTTGGSSNGKLDSSGKWHFTGSGIAGIYGVSDIAIFASSLATGGIRLRPNGGSDLTGTSGQASFASDGTLTVVDLVETSDERLKRDWRPLPGSFLEKLADIQTGAFIRTDTGSTSFGVPAQALKAALPEAVHEDADGHLGVHYGKAALVACVEIVKRLKEHGIPLFDIGVLEGRDV